MLPARLFLGGVELAVIGEHHVRPVGNQQVVRCDAHALSLRAFAISFTRPTGSITTPLPITFRFSGHRIPDGTRCRMYFVSLPTITVWPALFPPCPRTTRSADSVRKSTIFPFAFVAPLEAVDDCVHGMESGRAARRGGGRKKMARATITIRPGVDADLRSSRVARQFTSEDSISSANSRKK